MTSHEHGKTALLSALKNFFTKNLAVKIIALVFAILLWGYVLTDQKPVRTKSVPNVTLSFDGEAELLAQGFCVRGDREELLQNVLVSIRTQITNYAYINAGAITATVSLKNISEARAYELPVTAGISSSLGVVQSVTPATVRVEIDSLRNKSVPVTTTFTGSVPAGYWADMDALSATTRLDISGALTDIAPITRAECIVSLDGRTSTIYSTFDVLLYADGELVDMDVIVGTLPSSTVRLPIYAMKEVPVNVEDSLTGTDDLAANHELVAATATPDRVRIVGAQAVLDTVSSILLEPISVNGLSTGATVESELIIPEGVRVLDSAPVSVLLDIRESTSNQEFTLLPIEVEGLADGCSATVLPETVDMTITGRYSLVSMLKRSDVRVFVDVTGLAPGTYTLPLSQLIDDEPTTIEVTSQFSQTTVTVVIRQGT